jgi:hypothetical protein
MVPSRLDRFPDVETIVPNAGKSRNNPCLRQAARLSMGGGGQAGNG